MAVYEYKATDARSAVVAGTIMADTPRQARDLLRDQGLSIVEVRPAKAARQRSLLARPFRGRKGQEQVSAFVRELATLLSAGIPLLSALRTLEKQHTHGFQAVVQHLVDRITAGEALAEAMASQPAWFDELCVSIVRVGESTGSLETALKRLADFKERSGKLRNRITTALIYPAVVCLMGVGVTIFLMTYVVPNLLETLLQSGKPLPTVTRIVKAMSDFLLGYWWALVAGAVVAVGAVRAILASDRGQRAAHRLLLRVPVVGELVAKENTARIAVVMAALLKSGLQFVDAVVITRRTIRNRVFITALEEYEKAVSAGGDVSGPLEKTGVFSPMVVQMLAIGQESGQLEEMLERLAEAYDQEVATATARLTALLEPLLIVVLAVLVGFIAFATLLPILEASNVL